MEAIQEALASPLQSVDLSSFGQTQTGKVRDMCVVANRRILVTTDRVSAFDLVDHSTKTLPFESRKNITAMALSPSGRLLLVVDNDGRMLCVDYPRRTVLYRFNLKRPVLDIKFSPCGTFFAATHNTHIQVWRAPGKQRTFSPFVLHREFTGHFDEATCINWREDSRYFASGSQDMTVRVYSLFPEKKLGFVPVTFAGHRDTIVGVFWGLGGTTCYSVSRDAAVFEWVFEKDENTALGDADGATPIKRHAGKADTRMSVPLTDEP